MEPVYAEREYLSVTTIMKFVRCPRNYFYDKSGLVPKEQGNAMLYGSAMHRAVAVGALEGLDKGVEAFESVWDESLADKKRNLARAKAQLSHFIHSHAGRKSIYTFEKPPQAPSGIELGPDRSPFEIPAVMDVGLPVPIVVFIDGWVRHRDTGELWGWELKTTGRIDSRMFEALEMHPQILAYTAILRTISGVSIKGMMAEAILVDEKKLENITHPIPVQDHHTVSILHWLRFYGGLLLDCEKRYKETGDVATSFPKNFSGCSAYPNFYIPSFSCDFSNLCRVPNWENMVPYYDVRPDHKVQLTIEGKS